MKTTIIFALFVSFSVYGVSCNYVNQDGKQVLQAGSDEACPASQNAPAQNQAAPQQSSSSKAATCTQKLKAARLAQSQPAAGTVAAVTPPIDSELQTCRALEVVADSWGAPLVDTDLKQTTDKVATCTLRAGYTTDYNSCSSTASVYNTIVTMESLLLTTQTVRNTTNQTNIQTTAAASVASGDGQTAIYDATLADNAFKKNLNREQLLAYTAAVTLMGTKLAGWKSGCGSNKVDLAKYPPFTGTCETALATAKTSDSRSTVANSDAKSAFAGALIQFVAKAAKAQAAINALNANSAVVTAAKDATTAATSTFETCVINPLDESCFTTSSTAATTTGDLGTTDFSVGDGTASNSFDLGSGVTDGSAASTTTDANGAVTTPASPFSDVATQAKDILNPANAASVSPGSSGGGSSGGVGGGLGGGGASLGSDLTGADKGEKASEIKAASATGAYSGSGAKGFAALSNGKEENPFASMFDSKSQGGLEEDRSIASETGGVDSGLFQKISSRYQKVTADKRVEVDHE